MIRCFYFSRRANQSRHAAKHDQCPERASSQQDAVTLPGRINREAR